MSRKSIFFAWLGTPLVLIGLLLALLAASAFVSSEVIQPAELLGEFICLWGVLFLGGSYFVFALLELALAWGESLGRSPSSDASPTPLHVVKSRPAAADARLFEIYEMNVGRGVVKPTITPKRSMAWRASDSTFH
jgi:hypothetical protein